MFNKSLIILTLVLLAIFGTVQAVGAADFQELTLDELGSTGVEVSYGNFIDGNAFQNAEGISIITQITGDGNQVNISAIFNIYVLQNVEIHGSLHLPDHGGIDFVLGL